MKKINLITGILLLLFFQTGKSQEEENQYDVGSISLSLVMPDYVEGVSASHLSKLENKILRMLTSSGLSGNGLDANFVIFPKIEILGKDEIPGMETMTSVEVELNLFVKQMDENILFSSYSKEVKGISTTESRAIKNAIGKLPVKSKDIKTFLEETKGRILAYYKNKCNSIILEANRYSKMHQYEKAIAILTTIPKEVGDCHQRAQEKAIEYYQIYADQKCAEYLQHARAEEANRNYSKALKFLSYIDPSSTCKADAQKIIQRISTKVDAEEKKQWDFAMKRYESNQELKKTGIKVIGEVAKAYFSRSIPAITYKSLF